ncbi:MAG TPA: UdgX family uracil-DNA binding protein [Elusimicrobiota bacterium]|jgi:DNA polymerase|nr:UdgX family uracil-DNA binding protein [Elusimicrobiota bacterium]
MRELEEGVLRELSTGGLSALKSAAAGCRACPLWRTGTQTVFGRGREGASVLLVGEQPGDEEDREGEPFVGPSGRLLNQALDEAGISRTDVYVSNVVKHFKWEPRGKRRIHKKPSLVEVRACLPWLDAELELVRPRLVVCLGATAAQALLGRAFRVTEQRGRILPWKNGRRILATVHPSSILRAPDADERQRQREHFVADLRAARLGLRP